MIRTVRAGLRPAGVHVVGWLPSGLPVLSISGAAGDDDEDKDKDDPGDTGDEDDEDEEDEDEDGEDDDTGPVSREEYDKLKRRMRASDRRADKAESRLRKANGKANGKGDKDKEADDEATVQLRNDMEDLRSDNVALSVQLAVLLNKDAGRFHDPEDVVRFLDLDALSDDDGKIDQEAVSDALNDLAERKPHLVRATDGDGDEDKESGSDKEKETSSRRPSGRQTNRRKGKDKAISREALAMKYPALRR